MRYLLLVAYDGTQFAGSQRQNNARTVQGTLEDAARQVFGTVTRVTLSGRTDAGVHAAAQVAQLDGETPIPAHKLAEVLSRNLPDDVKVLASAAAPRGLTVRALSERRRIAIGSIAHARRIPYCRGTRRGWRETLIYRLCAKFFRFLRGSMTLPHSAPRGLQQRRRCARSMDFPLTC